MPFTDSENGASTRVGELREPETGRRQGDLDAEALREYDAGFRRGAAARGRRDAKFRATVAGYLGEGE